VRALVVVAHPCDDSLTHAAAAAAVEGLRRGGHQTDVVDLYADGFRAAMSTEERRAYHGDEPLLDPLARRYADLLLAADCLVVVYPTWWSGMPAILKGWFERVLVKDVAFTFDDGGKVRPCLHLRRIVGVSTYGSPRAAVKLVNDNGRRIVTRALRMTCGWRTRCTWLALYAVDTSTAAERNEFLSRVERTLAKVG
jgi:NAD(P)H dehydrogenase (quinone)